MSRIPLPYIIVTLLIAALIAFWDKSPTDLLTEKPVAEQKFPQSYMTNIALREYDVDGTLRNTLTAESAEYFQALPSGITAKDYTLIDHPRMVISSSAAAAPWFITAQQGRINQNGKTITLTTDVRASQDSDSQGLIEILTSELHIKTASQYAETDKAVKMRAQQGQLDTIGMKAYLDEDRIELLSQVRGTYEPE